MALTTLFLTGVEISARMYRGLITDLFGEGIRNVAANEFRVIPRALGANMTVTIQKGTGEDAVAYIKGDDVTGQGTYRITHDADFLDLTVAAAPASGTRTDLVVLEVVDSQVVGGSTNLSRFRVLTGVSALTTEKTVIPLARISVPTGTTSIQAANITDLRGAQTGGGAAVRTAAQPLSSAQISALTGMRVGDLVMNTDVSRVQYWTGSAWRAVGDGASGSTTLGSLALTTSFQTFAYYIGPGFSEITAAVDCSPVRTAVGSTPGGFLLIATGDATKAMVSGSYGGSSPTVRALTTTADVASVALANTASNANGCLLRNARLDSDGYLRFELASEAGQATPTSTHMTWRAR